MKDILNYIKVNKHIATAGQPRKKQFKKIAKKDFDVVINLAILDHPKALKDEDKIVSKLVMSYIHIPISWEKPEIDKLELFLYILSTLQKQKKKVFIHCIKNYRVSVFIYHYKKIVLKQKDTRLIAPKDFKPNKVWKEIIDICEIDNDYTY
ncbi:MAG: phosphatase [Campylobacterota bacterium]|nr:phosphatase [Campylobacterota bacterium]